jgi:hypothetical protein
LQEAFAGVGDHDRNFGDGAGDGYKPPQPEQDQTWKKVNAPSS